MAARVCKVSMICGLILGVGVGGLESISILHLVSHVRLETRHSSHIESG